MTNNINVNAVDLLFDIDKHDNQEKIYANFLDHEFSDLPNFMQAQMGNIATPSQKHLNNIVAQSVASIMDEGVNISANEASSADLRPKLVDQISGRSILIDTGASRSIWPVSDYSGRPPDSFKALRAVNNSTIQTFGTEEVKIHRLRTLPSHINSFWQKSNKLCWAGTG